MKWNSSSCWNEQLVVFYCPTFLFHFVFHLSHFVILLPPLCNLSLSKIKGLFLRWKKDLYTFIKSFHYVIVISVHWWYSVPVLWATGPGAEICFPHTRGLFSPSSSNFFNPLLYVNIFGSGGGGGDYVSHKFLYDTRSETKLHPFFMLFSVS